ncbi:hypothetical protein [Salipaludibacillus aurantiacus]|nr:hypothetical protein [Salipaludibacillus aurantiacus]
MSKNSKSKRNIQKGKEAVQPAQGEERLTISKSKNLPVNDKE